MEDTIDRQTRHCALGYDRVSECCFHETQLNEIQCSGDGKHIVDADSRQRADMHTADSIPLASAPHSSALPAAGAADGVHDHGRGCVGSWGRVHAAVAAASSAGR